MPVQANVFQFPQSVPASTLAPISLGGRVIPANKEIRIAGWCSDNTLYAALTVPGIPKVLEMFVDPQRCKIEDKQLLKEQLTSVRNIMAEGSPGLDALHKLAESLGN